MSQIVFHGENEEYRQRREELLKAEIELKDQIERVAALRRQLPPGRRISDYVFREGPADLSQNNPTDMVDVRFSDLFSNEHETLLMDHLMFSPGDELLFGAHDTDEPCAMCSMWADGYNAVAPHIEQRVSFVIVAQAEITRLRAFAHRRGWNRIRLLSCHDNTFYQDVGIVQKANDVAAPGLSVFTRASDGTIVHRYTIYADFDERTVRGIDLYSPVWQLFDLLPQGRGDWYPGHEYMERGRF